MKKYLLQVALVLTTFSSFSQTTGDYRSAGTGNWNVAGSWQIYNGAVWIGASFAPSSTDGVITIQSPHIITANTTITADQIIVASGSTLDKSASTFTIANGVGNDMTINGNLIINSNLSGPGNLVVNGTADWNSGTISCSTTISAGSTINGNQGAKVLGATLTNNGTINFTGDGIPASGGGTLINNGVFNKTVVSSTTTTMDLIWTNAGTINVLAGELNYAGIGSRYFYNTGVINISSGAIWNNTGNYYHGGGSMAGAGSFNQSNGTLTLDAGLVVPSTLTFNYTSGTTNGVGNLTVTDFTFTNGAINGPGMLIANGTTTWIAGSLNRNCTIAAANTLNIVQGGKTLGGTITNNGIINFTGNGIDNGGGTINNNATINKTVVGSSQTSIDLIWTNAGTINVLAGELNYAGIGGRYFYNTGVINISSGAIWNNTGNYYHGGGSMAGAGSFNQSNGTLTLDAGLVVPSTLTFNYTSGTTNGVGNLTVTNFTFTNGTINGPGMLIANGTTTWLLGSINRNFTISAGDILNLTSASRSLGGTLTNNGVINMDGYLSQAGSGLIINNTILNKTTLSYSSIGVVFTNNTLGIIKGTGTLNFTGTFTNNGTIAPGNSPGLLTVDGTQPFSASSTLAIQILNTTGVGTGHDQMARSGNLTLNGTLNVTELAVIPLSSFTIINLTSGIITGNFTTINLPFGYSITVGSTTVILNKVTTLPLNLISFGGRKLNSTVLLDWTTDNEVNTSHFVIERSVDGRNYTAIGNISSNNLSTRNQYQYKDQLPLSTTNYYRLKQVDINNSYTYTRIVKIDFRKSITVSISPNPAKDMMLIEGAENFEEAHIINLQGAILKKMKVVANLRLNVSDLRAGQYFVRLIGKAQEETISFLKQ